MADTGRAIFDEVRRALCFGTEARPKILPSHLAALVAQCSATPASVAATPPCSATPFQRQPDVPWQFKGDRCDRAFEGECSAILPLHLKNPRVLRTSAATLRDFQKALETTTATKRRKI